MDTVGGQGLKNPILGGNMMDRVNTNMLRDSRFATILYLLAMSMDLLITCISIWFVRVTSKLSIIVSSSSHDKGKLKK